MPETLDTRTRILHHLQSGQPLTVTQGLRLFGTTETRSRIWELRQSGHQIDDRWVTADGSTFKEYFLVPAPALEEVA